ncbi:Cation/calcium exchanger 5-like protein [Drosera capensis]
MAVAASLHHHSTLLISLVVILSTLFFFLITLSPPSTPISPLHPHRSLVTTSTTTFLGQTPFHTIPFLSLSVILYFYILIKAAQDHFSPIVTTLCRRLNLTPSVAAVTLLALGNGAPDVFATSAAVGVGQMRTGFGAILSAGAFVSGLTVGVVGICAGPYWVEPGGFVRDVGFYLVGVGMLFGVYLSGEIRVWQGVGFVGYYLVFVAIVFWMDFGNRKDSGGGGEKGGSVDDVEPTMLLVDSGRGDGVVVDSLDGRKSRSRCRGAIRKISMAWELPVSTLLKLTIPATAPSEWSRFYQSANIVLFPLALLYACRSFLSMSHPVLFLIPNFSFPLWSVVLLSSSSLGILHYIVEKEPPKTEQVPVVLVAFVMSVFWISTVAGELLNCLATLGELLELPPALLGLTVLAWGNSVGDLVADVALARAGQPALAMAGCFAGPMFNMMVGLGTTLVIQTTKVFPEAYELHFHISIVIAFVFLLLSLMGTFLVIMWCRFRVPRLWGFCLVGLYVFFMAVSLIIMMFSS